MILFPAIDILDGRCVRLYQGDYSQSTTYKEAPGKQAATFEIDGAKWLHVVDLDGAKAGRPVNFEAIRAIVDSVSIPVQVGGGVRTLADAKVLLDFGVQRVILGSRLVSDTELAATMFGELGERAVAGIDARNGFVAVHGWTEESRVSAAELAIQVSRWGGRLAIVTDIATDGALEGPNLDLMRDVHSASGLEIIVSGGVSSLDDLRSVANIPKGIAGVIVGKALYEGRFNVREAQLALK